MLLVVLPAMALLHGALGEWRFPLDAAVVAALCSCACRRPWQRRTLLIGYFLMLGLFVLNNFNITLASLTFYSEFAGSFSPPGWPLIASIGLCLSAIVAVGRIEAARSRAQMWTAVAIAFAVTGAGFAARAAFGSGDLRYALPIPSLTLGKAAARYALLPLQPKDKAVAAVPGPLAVALKATPWPHSLYVHTVESWADPAADLEQLSQYAARRFGTRAEQIVAGYRPWTGGTLNGELRELCGLERPAGKLSEISFPSCLPNELSRAGYDTTAGHGYQGAFYMRSMLYPRIGFKHSYFYDDLRGRLPTCPGAFRGLCDAQFHAWLVDQPHSSKRLVYFMSLQSHEPVPDATLDHAGLASKDGVRANIVAHDFVRSAIDTLSTHGPDACSELIYFAGDHEPPSTVSDSQIAARGVSYLLIRLKPTSECKP